ncbi:MAG: response regulator transcription factor [Chloroflexi bacterium]|nr:response regulator transcription factor [Chloroflexota bacterium]
MPLRFLVVDDHALFRDGMVSLLKAAGMQVVGEALNGAEAVNEAARLKPDVVLMDIDMPILNGIDATRKITETIPEIRVVMLTVSQEDDKLVDALRAGAKGYLLKSLSSDEFIDLLRKLEKGEPPIPSSVTVRLMNYVAQQSSSSEILNEKLTEREIELLGYLGLGYPNKLISEKLGVSDNTVKYHIKNILQKLNFNNRAEAAAYAVRHNLNPKM